MTVLSANARFQAYPSIAQRRVYDGDKTEQFALFGC